MAKATIWNPNTAEKRVINVGEAMPTGFSLWTGGTATGQQAQAAIKAPKLPTAVSSDVISSGQSIKTAPTPTTNDVTGYMAGLNTKTQGIESILQEINKPLPAQANIDNLNTQVNSTLDKLATKTQRTQDLYNQVDLSGQQKNLNDLMTQISAKNAQFEKASTDNQGRAVMTSMIGGQESLIRRQQAAEVGALTSMAQAVQGNISLSKQTIADTVDMEFKGYEDELKALQTQLDQNYEQLTREDKTRADKLKIVLDERSRLLEEQKAEKTNIYNIGVEAAKNGAGVDVLNKIAKAKTQEEALSLAGTYLKKSEDLPSSYQEWVLAGSPGTYASWVKDKNGTTPNIIKVNGVDYQVNPDGSLTTPNIPAVNKEATDLQNQAGTSAQQLLNKLNAGEGISVVGKSRVFSINPFTGKPYPGTKGADFSVQFDNLKSLLALDNVKLLKGQGQVSDSERKLLADASAKLDLSQSEGEFKRALQDITVVLGQPGAIQEKDDGTYSYKNLDGTVHSGKQGDNYVDKTLPAKLDLTGVTSVQTDTSANETTKIISAVPDGLKGGQCGRFVNSVTGLGVGDTYESKMSKMDPTITKPEPGMVFTMPYKNTGHTGFIIGINGDNAIVKDSNWFVSSSPETIATHTIPVSMMTGFRRI